MHSHSHTQWKKTYIHSRIPHVHHIHYSVNINAEIKLLRILILKRTRPTTSYVATMFHPTISQCTHQSLSNIATTKLGMIPQGVRGNQQDHT